MRKKLSIFFNRVRLLKELLYRIVYFLTVGQIYKTFHFSTSISIFASIRNKPIISIGKQVRVNKNVNLWCSSLEIGNNVGIGAGSNVFGVVKIGNDVMIAPNVAIMGGGHGTKKTGVPMKNQSPTNKGGVVIKDDVWIGANSVILDGVLIAEGSIIAAGSVLTSNTEKWGIYVGSPARLIKYRE